MEEDETTGWVASKLEGVSLPDQRFAANVIAITEQLNERQSCCVEVKGYWLKSGILQA